MKKHIFFNILDISRIALVTVAIFFGYQIGFREGYDPVAQLHFMVPLIIVAVAGISGAEALIWPKQAAEAKGYETGSNYQRQSAIALLSYAFIAVLVAITGWGLHAELTIYFAFLFFLVFSGMNHARDAIRNRNYKWQNINRPFITLLLIAATAYPVSMALLAL